MLALNRLLDRVLVDKSLNAVFAREAHEEFFSWNDGVVIKSNADLEEQFHSVYGPYICDDYVGQLEEMLSECVEMANREAVNGKEDPRMWNGWKMCSVVRMKVRISSYHLDIGHGCALVIENIFIRPCLRGKRILGKILKFFASRLHAGVRMCIFKCYSSSQAAMDKYYGGGDTNVFDSFTGRESRRAGVGTYKTYVMARDGNGSCAQSQQKLIAYVDRCGAEYPKAELLNGKGHDEISESEWNWAKLAILNYKYDLRLLILKYHFVIGYDVAAGVYGKDAKSVWLDDAVVRLRREITNPSAEESGVIAWLFGASITGDDSLFREDLFAVDKAVLSQYRDLYKQLHDNFLFQPFWDFEQTRRYMLKRQSTFSLKRAVEFLTKKEIDVGSWIVGKVPEFKEMSELKQYVVGLDRLLIDASRKDGICKDVLNHRIYDLVFKCDGFTSVVSFEMGPHEGERVQFIELVPKLIEAFEILTGDK